MRTAAALALLLLCGHHPTAARRPSKKKPAPSAPLDPTEVISAAMEAKQAGDLQGAYEILDRAIKAQPRGFPPYMAKGQMACAADDYQLCKDTYGKGLELAPAAHRGTVLVVLSSALTFRTPTPTAPHPSLRVLS